MSKILLNWSGIEDKFGVSASAPVMVAAGGAAAVVEETSFAIELNQPANKNSDY